MVRIIVALVLVAVFLSAAGPGALGAPGDIISSFPVTSHTTWPAGVYRDGTYVYFVVSWPPEPSDSAYKYTPAGEFVDHFHFKIWNWYPLNDPDHSRLGDGYMTAGTEGNFLITYELATGNWVGNTPIGIYDIGGYAYRGGGARFAFATDDAGTTYKFNPAWHVVSSFAWGGALAATDRYDGRSGNYVIVNSTPAYVYTGAGSLVGTFANRGGRGCTCGPGYPAGWGTTFWNYRTISATEYMVYQIDLGNATVSILPASAGRIKALFR